MYWFTRKAKLRTKLLEIAHVYSELMDKSGARIEELERQLKGAEEESSYFIGLFSMQINQLKTEVEQLRIEDDLYNIESDLMKRYIWGISLLAQNAPIPGEELEKQATLIERLLSARQEYQQTE